MSLILEALKKSERQRRLGKAPTLATPTTPLRRRPRLPLLVVLLVLLALVAWWLLRGLSLPWSPAVQQQAPATAPVAGDDERDGDAMVGMETPIVTHQPPPPVSTPVQPEAPAPAQPAQAQPKVPPQVAAPAATPPATTFQAPEPAAPAPAEDPAVQLVWDLPYAVRRDLPELSLTMHVYADHPAGRMAIINGERHGEGDELAEGLVLRRIRSDGLLLEFRGQTFLYPRGGR